LRQGGAGEGLAVAQTTPPDAGHPASLPGAARPRPHPARVAPVREARFKERP
jgi:hypothetical protein